MKTKKKSSKSRNWTAIHAHFRSGAGLHKKTKRKFSKEACRGKVDQDEEDFSEWDDFEDGF